MYPFSKIQRAIQNRVTILLFTIFFIYTIYEEFILKCQYEYINNKKNPLNSQVSTNKHCFHLLLFIVIIHPI